MARCFKCGVSDERAKLFDAIASGGIVKICNSCSRNEGVPVINRKEVENSSFSVDLSRLREPPKKKTIIYERLSKLTGFQERPKTENEVVKKQDLELKKVMDANFKKAILSPASTDDFIENFHWLILRARRLKKLTQEQFAEQIREPLSAVQKLEQGIVPANYQKLIEKVESTLGIYVLKNRPAPKYLSSQEKMEFDELSAKSITVGDLKEVKEKKQKGFFERLWKSNDDFRKEEDFQIDDSGLDLFGDILKEKE